MTQVSLFSVCFPSCTTYKTKQQIAKHGYTSVLQFSSLRWSKECCLDVPPHHVRETYTRKTQVFLTVTAPVIHKLWLNQKLSVLKTVLSPPATIPLSLGWGKAWWRLLDLCRRSDPHCVFWEGSPISVLQCRTNAAKDQIYLIVFLVRPGRDPDFLPLGQMVSTNHWQRP